MRHTDHRGSLEVNIETKECSLPDDQQRRIQPQLNQLAEAVGRLPATLDLVIVRHPRSDRFHVEASLKLPRRSLFTGQWDPYLDPALEQCLRKLIRKVEVYHQEPNRQQDQVAADVAEMHREIVAPEEPDEGSIGQAVQAGDYAAFRRSLAHFEDWLRLSVGRWLQRYPEADARVGSGLAIGDLVEEVLLNAFERYDERSRHETVRDFLDDLLDPSLHALLRSPVEERENIDLARTLRETPL
jgi:hypothetical protein